MHVSEALVVGEEWISEHYFSTDAKKESFQARVLERRKEWDAAEEETPRSRFTARRAELERDLVALGELVADDSASSGDVAEAAASLRADLLDLLGYTGGEYSLTSEGPLTRVRPAHLPEGDHAAVLAAHPVTAVDELLDRHAPTLAEPWLPAEDENHPVTSVASALSRLMTDTEGPRFALVLAGRWCLVTERERWPEGRWLAVDLQLVAERNDARRGGEVDRALTILSAASLAPDPEGDIWWADVLEESVRHTVGVSKDLQVGVRDSVEIIANEVVARRRSQGLGPLPPEDAQVLATQSLRYLYRILFLLYAESSPELGILPVGSPEYDAGYGLDRLRDLVLVDVHTPDAMNGTHLYESLDLLFRKVDQGHASEGEGEDGMVFHALRADLFAPGAIDRIGEVQLGNAALLQVLRKLLLTQEVKGGQRGFISYVDLGINQLGAVYEGLMSYTGFFAAEDLYEVAKKGDRSDGSWVVPVDRSDHIPAEHFVTFRDDLGEDHRVVHRRGEFVYRLSGRDRQRSASYYTPEVLTRFTVQQGLEELLDQDGHTTTAEEVLGLTVCEPALGSGAFAIEAVRQLAEEYLRRREAELGERVEPDQRPQELQKVKAHIALHQVYGVDLNATAVELAEISLWLDTMVAGLQAPWFGLRLRRGNSLIGARREFYGTHQLAKKAWLTTAPAPESVELLVARAEGAEAAPEGSRIAHFLLPARGWGSAAEAPKAVRDLMDSDDLKALKAWRSSIRSAPTKKQIERLTALTQRVEDLWFLSLRRLQIAQRESSRSLDLWGRDEAAASSAVSREEIEAALSRESGSYQRLRKVMDAWCALWFWPVDAEVKPPALEEWITACEGLLGLAPAAATVRGRYGQMQGQKSMADIRDWEELDGAESLRHSETRVRRVDEVLEEHPWLRVCEAVATEQAFFHWELDFAAVFAGGGFDLQVGNPPWVRPDVDIPALFAEHDPWWVLAHKPTELEKAHRREDLIASRPAVREVLHDALESAVTAEVLGDPVFYPVLSGRPDLYRAFMAQVWRNAAATGMSSLIHTESHFTDDKATALRRATYRRLRRHWQFINELHLFDIDHHVGYGIHVYGAEQDPAFLQAASLYHPDSVRRSLQHDGSGAEPGLKDPGGDWDLRPHRDRIQLVESDALHVWARVMGSSDPQSSPMVYTVNRSGLEVLERLASSPRIAEVSPMFSGGWNETTDRAKGRFELQWGESAWRDAILQGPHLHVGIPLYQEPNSSMKSNLDWSRVDLETLAPDHRPVTAYKPAGDRAVYDNEYTHWTLPCGERVAARDYYRLAWRRMAANTGERTLTPALIPRGVSHVHPVNSMGGLPEAHIVLVAGSLSSLLADYSVRAVSKSDIHGSTVARLPVLDSAHPMAAEVLARVLRLNCVVDAYAPLWEEVAPGLTWAGPVLETCQPAEWSPQWSPDVVLRRDLDRRNALVELDALVALMLGVSVDDLCAIYRTQFPVLYGYDQSKYVFDANGRIVPTPVLQAWRKKGEALTEAERTHTHPGSGVDYVYEFPFAPRDREADFRTAYAEFERRLEAAGGYQPSSEESS